MGETVFVCAHTPFRLWLGGREAEQPAGTCLLLGAASGYRYGTLGEVFDNTWFHARGDGVALAEKLRLPFDTPLQPARCEYVVPLVHEMLQEVGQDGQEGKWLAGLAAEKLLVLLARHLREPAGARLTPAVLDHLERLRRVRMEMRENVEREWSVAELARRGGLSPSRFSAVYRACFAVSPMEDLIRARLDKAAWLLASTTQPVRAVAAACGFESVHYFSRLFHRRMGHPPSRHGRA